MDCAANAGPGMLSDFVSILRCPETHQKLVSAPAELLERLRREQAASNLMYQSGKPVVEPLEAGLLREDGRVLYAVSDGIPVLVKEEAISLPPGRGI